jgi:hypothetical protein
MFEETVESQLITQLKITEGKKGKTCIQEMDLRIRRNIIKTARTSG